MNSGKTTNTANFKRVIPTLMILLLGINSFDAKAQSDEDFTVNRNGKQAVFSYKVLNNSKQVSTAKGITYPLYGFRPKEVERIKELLTLFTANEAEYALLQKDSRLKDSIYKAKIALYVEMDTIQELRLRNYVSAYNSLDKINQQLDHQVVNCEKAALVEERNRKLKASFFGGVVGLSVGILAGLLLH